MNAAEVLDVIFDRCIPEPNTGCLLWDGPLFDGKYGGVYIEGERKYVHRAVLECKLGRGLQPGECALHKCDVMLCIRQDHIFVGTQCDNMDDMAKKGRSKSKTSPDLIIKIRGMYATGDVTIAALSRELGMPQSTVRQYVRGARWTKYLSQRGL